MNIGNKVTVAKNLVTSTAGRQLLKAQKNSPTLLFGAGVVGVVATAVMASKATLKLDDLLRENEQKREKAQAMLAEQPTKYPAKEYAADMAKMKTKLVLDITKLYAPAVVIGVGSVCALTGSHVILTRRNSGLIAAYAALDKGYTEYRQRVTELVGPEKEKELYQGVEDREIQIETANGVETKTIAGAKGRSPYARLYNKDTCNTWSPEPAYRLLALRSVQQHMNDMLHIRGHVFLNDVFDALGMDRTQAGAVVGWVLNNPKGGDNYIDLGIWDDRNMMSFHEFMTGDEGAMWLDFNVDGVVYNLI